MEGNRGIGLLGVLAWLAVIALIVWMAVRIVPIYFEYWAINKVFTEQVRKADLYDSAQELEVQVLKELRFQDLNRLDARSVEVERLSNGGRFRVYAEYEAVVPLSGRARLVFTFRPEATGG